MGVMPPKSLLYNDPEYTRSEQVNLAAKVQMKRVMSMQALFAASLNYNELF